MFVFLSITAIGWTVYLLWGDGLIKAMHEGRSVVFFNLSEDYMGFLSVQDMMTLARKTLFILTGLSGLMATILLFERKFINLWNYLLMSQDSEDWRSNLFSTCVWLGCSWLCFYALYSYSYQGEWYQIQKVMTFSEGPPYQHRVLFVWVANGIKAISPGISYQGCYFLSQAIAILLAFYFIKKWGELFIAREMAFLSQILLVLLLIPTFRYFTFYDIGIILFYTISLLSLFKGRFYLYFMTLLFGTLNHEITMFLIFIFAVMYYDSSLKRSQYWGFIFIQVFIYGATRFWLFFILPMSEPWGVGRVWFNLNFLLNSDRRLLFVFLNIFFWYLIAFLGFKEAPQKLRRCVMLFPLLLITTFLVGQFNEIRHFNAFAPIIIGLIISIVSNLTVKKRE